MGRGRLIHRDAEQNHAHLQRHRLSDQVQQRLVVPGQGGGGGLRVGVRDTPHPRHNSTPFRSRAPPNTTVQYSESRASGAWSVRCGRCAPSVRCPVSTINHFDTIFSAHVQKILLDLAPWGDREKRTLKQKNTKTHAKIARLEKSKSAASPFHSTLANDFPV